MQTVQGRPFTAATSKFAYAQAFTGTSRRTQRPSLLSRLAGRRTRTHV